jgi:hypothetical protein
MVNQLPSDALEHLPCFNIFGNLFVNIKAKIIYLTFFYSLCHTQNKKGKSNINRLILLSSPFYQPAKSPVSNADKETAD